MSGKPLRVLGIEIDLSGKKAKDDLAEWNRELRAAKGFSEDFTEGVDDMAREMRDYARSVGISAKQLKEMREIASKNRELGEFAEKYRLNAGQIKRMGLEAEGAKTRMQNLKGVMGGLAALGIGAAVKSIGGEMLDLARQAEQSQIQFEVMLKSPEKAKETLNMLKEFSDITPFSDTEAIAAGKQLINAKVPLDQLKQTLLEVGDVAAGSGIAFGELAEIYSKNKMSGLIQLEDVNQLAGRGIPIMEELAQVMGVGSEQIRSLTSSGAVKFEHLRQAFANMSKEGGFYAGMMDKLSLSGAGLASTFDSKLASIKKILGGVLLEGLKPLWAVGIFFLDWLQKTPAAMTVLKIAILALTPIAILFFASVIFKAIKAMNLLSLETLKFGVRMVIAFLPIYLIIAVVIALILIIEDLYTAFTGGDSIIGQWIDVEKIKAKFSAMWGAIKGFFSSLLNFFKEYGKYFIMAIFPISAVYFYWDEIVAFIKSIPDKIVEFFKSIPDRIMAILSGIKEYLKNLLPPAVMSLLVKTGFMDDKKQIQARAGGGDINTGDEYIVGEKGPELFRSDRAGTIIPNHALGGGRKSTSITLAPVFNISGVTDPETVANLAVKKLENMLPLIAAELGFGLG